MLDRELWQQVLSYHEELKLADDNISWRKIQKRFGLSDNRSRELLFALNNRSVISGEDAGIVHDEPKVTKDFKISNGCVTTMSLRIKTVEDALEYAETDMNVWEYDRHVINFWPVTIGGNKTGTGKPETYTNYQVKVWLKRKIEDEKQIAIQNLIDRLISEKPQKHVPLKKNSGEILAVPGLVDHHFGMLAWGKETGEGDYDLDIAERFYINAIDEAISILTPHRIGRFLLPLGSDFFHINSPDNTTPKNNNPLDVDSRLIKILEVGQRSVIYAVDRMAKIAPVDLEWIPGNHDPEASFYLCKIIEAYYRNNDNVTVNTSPTMRKFVKWGNNLIGLTHGDEEPHKQLPTIMADSCPEWWGQCKHKEWLIGHIHKKKEMNFVGVDSFGGTTVRFLPSLCRADQWHYRKGYIGGDKAMEVYAYDKYGMMGYFPIYQRRLEAA